MDLADLSYPTTMSSTCPRRGGTSHWAKTPAKSREPHEDAFAPGLGWIVAFPEVVTAHIEEDLAWISILPDRPSTERAVYRAVPRDRVSGRSMTY